MSKNIATISDIRAEAAGMESQIVAALPAHIPVERFTRVVLTAVQNNPKLLECTRESFWSACIMAAQDGLLPDGRDGAIVPYKSSARWMVMIGGIRKKVRNSGDIATWDVQAVFENDKFDYELGDSPRIYHKPTLDEPGKLVAVYSIAVLKSGEISRDVMSVSAVEKIRGKAQYDTVWKDPVFYPEMAKKTVARRHSKVLPMSTDLDDLIRRDDELYNLAGVSDAVVKPQSGSMADKMAALASDASADPETGEIADDRQEEKSKKSQKTKTDKKDRDPPKGANEGSQSKASRSGSASDDASHGADEGSARDDTADPTPNMDDMTPLERAGERGMLAAERNISRRAIPHDYKKEGAEDLKEAWLMNYDDRKAELKDV